MNLVEHMTLAGDVYDQRLIENCHPPRWTNPIPSGRYNLVAIGAGAAGLISAGGAATLGARAAIIERALMGGDCLNVGCVPSKGVIRAARAAYDLRDGHRFGAHLTSEPRVDFAEAMERMRRLRAQISPNDGVARFTNLGVDVYLGQAQFVGPTAIEVEGARLEFDRAVITTGGRPIAPPIPGLAEAGYLTNETLFTLTELPRRLVVLGAGPVGCELAQAFLRFGSEVTMLSDGRRILPKEDADAGGIVRRQLEREGLRLRLETSVARVARRGAERVVDCGRDELLTCDAILVATGRAPNIEGLGLEAAGVRYSRDGIEVDDRLRTSNPRVFAAGDVCSRFKFTHAADAQARIALANALFFGRRRVSALVLPWCTYTDPEVAHVGYYEAKARAAGYHVVTVTEELKENDRAILDGEEEGFARVHYDRRTGRILGGTIVARHAGEMIGELTLAITTRQKVGALAATIHPYPTQAEVLRKIGDAYTLGRLTPGVKKIFEAWFAWRR